MHPACLYRARWNPTESEPVMNVPTSVPGNSGPGWEPPLAAEQERFTENVHTLLTPSTKEAFRVWAGKRSMKPSAAVRALIEDALWREVRGEPLGPLYGDLPASMARQIVASSQDQQPPVQA